MFQPVSLYLALRYSRSRYRSPFTRFISRFSMLGILLGVMALIVVTSVMNGFEAQLKTRILGVVPQVTVVPQDGSPMQDWQQVADQIEWPAQVQHVSPFVQAEGLVQGARGLQAVLIQGVFPEQEPEFSVIRDNMITGSLNNLQPGSWAMLMGRPLSSQLDIFPGERVRLIAAQGQHYTPLGLMPAQRQFSVNGLFELGSEVDSQLVLLHGDDAARLFRMRQGEVSGLRLYLQDAFQAAQVSRSLSHNPIVQQASLTTQSWESRYGRLFQAVRMEKAMMMIMLGLIVAVAAFNAVSALIMLVQDKRADIAILQTLGLGRAGVYKTLLLQGMYSGVVGAFGGIIAGLLVTFGLNDVLALVGADIFGQGEQLPVVIDRSQVALIAGAALTLTFLATLYPAWRAAQIQPAETLRYE